MEKEEKINVKGPIIFVDEYGIPRDALVTMKFTGMSGGNVHGCNLVFVEGDPKRDDSYGRQMGRETSVVHKSVQAAPGNYWCHESELDDAQRKVLNQDRA